MEQDSIEQELSELALHLNSLKDLSCNRDKHKDLSNRASFLFNNNYKRGSFVVFADLDDSFNTESASVFIKNLTEVKDISNMINAINQEIKTEYQSFVSSYRTRLIKVLNSMESCNVLSQEFF